MTSWRDARHGNRSIPRSGYGTAEICLNGHAVTSDIEFSPELRSKHCASCGAETITACLSCGAPIRGHYHSPGVITLAEYTPPRFCHDCGKPLPWTQSAIEAAYELADEVDEFTQEDKDKFRATVVELASDSPKTEVASIRYKKLMSKAGPIVADAMGKIVVSITTEAAKKMLGL